MTSAILWEGTNKGKTWHKIGFCFFAAISTLGVLAEGTSGAVGEEAAPAVTEVGEYEPVDGPGELVPQAPGAGGSYIRRLSNGEYVHVFMSDSTFVAENIDESTEISYLIVGGGGSGGSLMGGGGGAGAVRVGAFRMAKGESLTVHVGTGGVFVGSAGECGVSGEATEILLDDKLVDEAAGGGGGGGWNTGLAFPGASSGGQANGYKTEPAEATDGHCGGVAFDLSYDSPGGGGGAGTPGQDGSAERGGAGGDGVICRITGEAKVYGAGGGGAGGGNYGSFVAGPGGSGGVGGNGDSKAAGKPGLPYTGSGGGGGFTGGNGARGVVVLRYAFSGVLPPPSARIGTYEEVDGAGELTESSPCFGGDEVRQLSNGEYVHVFRTSGAFIAPSGNDVEISYLVVGGGGSGGSLMGGGGGAGAVRTGTCVLPGGGTLNVEVGAGGRCNSTETSAGMNGRAGGDSVLSCGAQIVETARGGGGGGGWGSAYNGEILSGASSGGLSQSSQYGEATAYCGHVGGKAYQIVALGAAPGGGGGAYTPGGDGFVDGEGNGHAGDGGSGLVCAITGDDRCYGAGGGGAGSNNATYGKYAAGQGGSGIGGNGGVGGSGGGNAVANTGSGGGGGGGACGNGADGVVVLRYRYENVPVDPQLNNATVEEVYPGSALLAATIVTLGKDATNSSVWVVIEQGGTVVSKCVAADVSAVGLLNNLMVEGLRPGTDYSVYLVLSNDLGNVARSPSDGNLSFRTPAGATSFVGTSLAELRLTPCAFSIWDARANGGPGVHLDGSRAWVNLVDGQPDLVYNGAIAPGWTRSGYLSDKDNKGYFSLSEAKFMQNMGTRWTVQALVTPSAVHFSSDWPAVCGCWNASKGMRLGLGGMSGSNYTLAGMTTKPDSGTRTGITAEFSSSVVDALTQLTLTATPEEMCLYTNGHLVASVPTADSTDSELASSYFSVGSSVNGATWVRNCIFGGMIHAVRVYTNVFDAATVQTSWAFDRTLNDPDPDVFHVIEPCASRCICRAKFELAEMAQGIEWEVWAARTATYGTGDITQWTRLEKLEGGVLGPDRPATKVELRTQRGTEEEKYLYFLLVPKGATTLTGCVRSPLYYIPDMPRPKGGLVLVFK